MALFTHIKVGKKHTSFIKGFFCHMIVNSGKVTMIKCNNWNETITQLKNKNILTILFAWLILVFVPLKS